MAAEGCDAIGCFGSVEPIRDRFVTWHSFRGMEWIFPSEASIVRLIGAVLPEANDEWQMQHRYMGVEAMGEMLNPPPTSETLQLPPKAA